MSTAAAVHPNHASSPCSSVDSVFSVVNSPTNISTAHTPHTAHPLPLREQAFTLHCQGLRSPAISAELGVPERTIRAWIASALADLKDDLQSSRKEQLLLAVERQHQITACAWQQFEAEAAARDALLDAALQTILNAGNDLPGESGNTSSRPLHFHLPVTTPAPRYLNLILQANKEISRLLGLHALASDVPDSPDIEPPSISSSKIPAESATATLESQNAAESATDIPAKTAIASNTRLAAGLQPASLQSPIPSPSLVIATPAVAHIPAESATASGSPLLVGEGLGVGFPAKTATAPSSSSSRPAANSGRRAHIKPHPWMM